MEDMDAFAKPSTKVKFSGGTWSIGELMLCKTAAETK